MRVESPRCMHGLIALWMILATVAVNLPDTLGASEMPPQNAVSERTLELPDGGELRYAIAMPRGRSADTGPRESDSPERMPLVLALHFGWAGGPVPAGLARAFLTDIVEPGVRELGAVIVAPYCPGRGWTEPGSEVAVIALLEEIRAEHPIDDERIVVTGFSLGGMGTWYLAARHPETFSAAIPMAGRPRDEWLAALGAAGQSRGAEGEGVRGDGPGAIDEVPLFVIHSRQDEVVPIDATERAVKALEETGATIEYLFVEGIGHYQTGRYVPYLREAASWVLRVWSER